MIHQYKMDGLNIVLDVCSGGVHLVDEIAYDMIALYESEPRETVLNTMLARYGCREDVTETDLEQCYDEITALKLATRYPPKPTGDGARRVQNQTARTE